MIYSRHFVLLVFLICAIKPVIADLHLRATRPQVELLHFWISPGETDALGVLAENVRQSGGQWYSSSSSDYQSMKRDALMRISTGFAPTAMLWLTGEDVEHIYALGHTVLLDSLAHSQDWNRFIYDFVFDLISIDGNEVVQPVTIHNENWIWYNAEIYRRFDLQPPRTWKELLSQAKLLHENGIIPIASSDASWTTRFIFINLVASILGQNGFQRLYVDQDPSVLDSPGFQRVLDVLEDLRRYRAPMGRFENWSSATRAIMEGEAAMQFMGDWAQGEFTHAGLVYEKDYLCSAVPESSGLFIVALDSIVYLKQDDFAYHKGQSLLQDLIFDRQLQIQFAARKGSTPVRMDIESSELQDCINTRVEALQDSTMRLLTPRITMREYLRTGLQREVAEFWYDDKLSKADLLEQLKKLNW